MACLRRDSEGILRPLIAGCQEQGSGEMFGNVALRVRNAARVTLASDRPEPMALGRTFLLADRNRFT